MNMWWRISPSARTRYVSSSGIPHRLLQLPRQLHEHVPHTRGLPGQAHGDVGRPGAHTDDPVGVGLFFDGPVEHGDQAGELLRIGRGGHHEPPRHGGRGGRPLTTFTLPRPLGKNDPGISVILFFYKTWTWVEESLE